MTSPGMSRVWIWAVKSFTCYRGQGRGVGRDGRGEGQGEGLGEGLSGVSCGLG